MQTSTRSRARESVEDLKQRAIRRARVALGRFGNGIAHVVLRPRGERRCRTFVVALRFGSASVKEAGA